MIKTVACAIAMSGIFASYFVGPYQPLTSDINMEHAAELSGRDDVTFQEVVDWRIERGPVRETMGYVFGPINVVLDLLGNRVRARTPMGAVKETLHNDYRYILGYFVLFAGIRRAHKIFFHIPVDDFVKSTNQRMHPNPKRVLYLASLSDGDQLQGFPEFDFATRYQAHPNATFRNFTDVEELIRVLSEFEGQPAFDRIEFFSHGRPNALLLADGDKLRPSDLENLKTKAAHIATENADLRIFACSLAGGRLFNPKASQTLMAEIGDALLHRGGRVFASARNVAIAEAFVPASNWRQMRAMHESRFSWIWPAFAHTYGLGNFILLFKNTLFDLNRSFQASVQDNVMVEISPEES